MNMNKKSLAVAVILLFIGVAIAPSINADVSKQELDIIHTNIESDEDCGCDKEPNSQEDFPKICDMLDILLSITVWGAFIRYLTGLPIIGILYYLLEELYVLFGCGPFAPSPSYATMDE